MNQKQYRHAYRTLRVNGWDHTAKFFRNYPDRLEALAQLSNQGRDKLADRAYMKSLHTK